MSMSGGKPAGERTKNRRGRPRLEVDDLLADLATVEHLSRRAQAIALQYVNPSVPLHILTMLECTNRVEGIAQPPLMFKADDPEYMAQYAEVLLAHLPPPGDRCAWDVEDLRAQLESAKRRLRRYVERCQQLDG
jgi:hypothetical protein